MSALVDGLRRRRARAALGERAADDVLALEAEDGRYTVASAKIVYVKRFARESRVGFGG